MIACLYVLPSESLVDVFHAKRRRMEKRSVMYRR